MNRVSLLFYVGLPVALSILNGLRGSLYAPDLGPGVLIPFWYVCSQFYWLVSAGLTVGVARSLSVQGPGLLVLAAFCGWISIALSYFYLGFVVGVFRESLGSLSAIVEPGGYLLVDPFVSFAFGPNALGGITAWVAAFALRNRILTGSWGTLSTTQAATPGGRKDTPEFLQKANPAIGQDLIAVEAQEHYLKIYTMLGEDMVMYRMRDAVSELKDWPGVRVHRSFWVAKSAVQEVEKTGRTFKLTLTNGLQVPVSQSYRGLIEQEGLVVPP
ncbi:MAG: LytTR family DNA-binding domain-containing protein [Rhodospirillaceae bacterium]